jgi:hypothetical protein
LLAALSAVVALTQAADQPPRVLESSKIQVRVAPGTGAYELTDKRTGVVWSGDPRQSRLGAVVLREGSADRSIPLQNFQSIEPKGNGQSIVLIHPLPGNDAKPLAVQLKILPDDETLEIACVSADPRIRRIRLLDGALWVADADRGSVLVPTRLGMLIPADSGKAFQHNFPTSGYEGCHCEMVALAKSDSLAMITWRDIEGLFQLQSITEKIPVPHARQVLLPSLELSSKAMTLRIRLMGKATYGQLARAYREVAKEKGLVVTWDEKLRDLPRREALFGASNVKLWTCLNRRMDENSQHEEAVRVEWTFDQAAQIAEHLKKDLQIDRVLFTLGGWTNGGYDCRHPDIMPANPECGGNAGLADCSRRMKALGYTLCLHDNYEDMYHDAPSWSEDWLMKDQAGKPRKGGRWLGGRSWLTCAQKALELAQRPQNLPEVRRVVDPEAYFIDTTFAVGPQECFDPKHPLTRADDVHWKQELSRYARQQFGIFGSECGREWAIPCADFFEGLSGVSGRHYHNAETLDRLGARPFPVFEMIYHDCIQIYGKYGYRPEKATSYVLHHLLVGRPLNYHQFPPGLYWQHTAKDTSLPVKPGIARVESIGKRRIRITYTWSVEGKVEGPWHVLVHLTNPNGRILAQNDHDPKLAQWSNGQITTGPFEVNIPDAKTPIDIRVGLFQPKADLRATLIGSEDGERRYLVGRLQLQANRVAFEPPPAPVAAPRDGLFLRADHGWAQGLHPLDRFVKNTHEILAPINRLSSQLLLSEHEFLTPDGLVRRSTFGDGRIEVVANLGNSDFTFHSQRWGDVVLPPDGFLAHSPEFLAFHARNFRQHAYQDPPLFTITSLDGQPLEQSARVRVYHGFGDPDLAWFARPLKIEREAEQTK